MRVSMTINEAVDFLSSHVEGMECGMDECFFVEQYELKEICAIKCLICSAGHLERIRPELLERPIAYEYNASKGNVLKEEE